MGVGRTTAGIVEGGRGRTDGDDERIANLRLRQKRRRAARQTGKLPQLHRFLILEEIFANAMHSAE